MEFFKSSLIINALSQALFIRKLLRHSSGFTKLYLRYIIGLYLAAYFSLSYVIQLFNTIVDFM